MFENIITKNLHEYLYSSLNHNELIIQHTNYNRNNDINPNNIDNINSFNKIDIPKGAAIIGLIAALLICLIGFIGNLITIMALFRQTIRYNNHTTTTTIFVIHLAIVDLLFCLLIMPLQMGRYWTRSWPFGSLLCRLYPLFYYGIVATSLMLITAITINRFVLISFNRYYTRLYNRRNVILMIIFCWLFSYTLISIPTLQLYGRTGYQNNTFSCTILRDTNGRSPKKFLFVLGFFLPMITIIFCYGMILYHIRKQRKQQQQQQIQNSNNLAANANSNKTVMIKTSNRDIRLTILICVVFGAFLGCFLPLFIGNVFIPDNRYPYFHVFASICAWMNSCINPFIYFAMNQRYRQAYKRLFIIKFLFYNHNNKKSSQLSSSSFMSGECMNGKCSTSKTSTSENGYHGHHNQNQNKFKLKTATKTSQNEQLKIINQSNEIGMKSPEERQSSLSSINIATTISSIDD